ncbi:hypothetical protein ANO11243_085490 [Dothideomycetidae sp. 11243]|nr:hypothetical protein ANO11243_085490 [fungal sp. No.11243]
MRSLALSFLCSLVAAQQVVQDSWIAPSLPDLGTTITEGEQYTLTWDETLQNWFGQYAPEASTTNVTLWVAAVQLSFAHIVEQYVDVTRTRQITWNASLPASEYAQDKNWSFRFTPANFTKLANDHDNEVDSPQFIFKAASTTASSSSATSTTTTSSATSATSASPSPTGKGGSKKSSSSLSGGAIAGIVIGALAGVALVAALFFLLFRLRRRDSNERGAAPQQQKFYNETSSYGPTSPSMGGADSVQPYYAAAPLEHQQPIQEAPYSDAPHELAGNEAQELDSNDIKPPGGGTNTGAYEPYRSPK